MTEHADLWPSLSYEDLAPTVDHLNRLVQVAGKYTLSQAFEPGWAMWFSASHRVGWRPPRCASTTSPSSCTTACSTTTWSSRPRPALGRWRCAPSRWRISSPLSWLLPPLGLPAPASTIAAEIADAAPLDADRVHRPWDPRAARGIWAAFNAVAGALEQWQASYRGHRPRVGVMWGGLDLSATRYRAVATTPPTDRPPFMQHGMSEEYVAVGFSFGSPDSPAAAVYAYIAPQPDGLQGRSWGPDGAGWIADAGLAVLPWETLRATTDPRETIIAFADAVYAAAVETAGWPADLVGPRFDGWHASRIPPAGRGG